MIYVSSKRKKNETILKAFPNALIIDVTSKSSDKWIAFSPFYPHGNIPIPFLTLSLRHPNQRFSQSSVSMR